jgi:hypothetical protein
MKCNVEKVKEEIAEELAGIIEEAEKSRDKFHGNT